MTVLLPHIKQRKNFYRNIYRGTLKTLIGSLFLIVVLLLANLYYLYAITNKDYYATSTEGELYSLIPSIKAPEYADFSQIENY